MLTVPASLSTNLTTPSIKADKPLVVVRQRVIILNLMIFVSSRTALLNSLNVSAGEASIIAPILSAPSSADFAKALKTTSEVKQSF